MHVVSAAIQRFLSWSWLGKVIFLLFIIVPLCSGYVLWYFVGVNVYGRTRPDLTPKIAKIRYVEETSALGVPDALDRQQEAIVDSLQKVMPISYNVPLPPFELYSQTIQNSKLTAHLFHCRLWCDCRNDIPLGSFQLLVFQLSPTTSSYTLVADTVMRYEDYVRPFTLQRSQRR